MKKAILITLCTVSVGLGSAQETMTETCESLTAGFEATIEKTQSMIRETRVKAGFFQVAYVKSSATQTPEGLEVVVLEQSGQALQEDPEMSEPESRFFERMNLSSDQCVDHKLKVLKDNRYELEITENDEETPQLGFTFVFNVDNTAYILESVVARVKPPQMPIAINMETTFSDWQLE